MKKLAVGKQARRLSARWYDMDKSVYAEWLAKARAKGVKEEREKVLVVPGNSPKDYYNELGDYELAGMVYVGDTLALTLGVTEAISPQALDAIIRAWASQYITERGGKLIVDLPIWPISAHLRSSIERGTPIRGWYGVANAIARLPSPKAQSLLDTARKALVTKHVSSTSVSVDDTADTIALDSAR